MQTYEPALVHAGNDLLGECPVWDDKDRTLYRVDSVAGSVCVLNPDAGTECRYPVGRHVGSLVLRADGDGVLVAAHGGFFALDLPGGRCELLAPVEHDKPDLLMNDGKCDPAGRFLAGTMHSDAVPGRGGLFRFVPPDRAAQLLPGVGISNGLGWDAAGTTLYYIDSLLHQVDRLGYDPERGIITSRQTAFDLSRYPGLPDGMTIDSDDCLWIAFWRGGAVRRFAPDGRMLAEITLPVRRTTSCCLGGEDLRTLFITTARRAIRSAGSADQPERLGGAVFACRVEVPGVPTSRWRPDPGEPPPRQPPAARGPALS